MVYHYAKTRVYQSSSLILGPFCNYSKTNYLTLNYQNTIPKYLHSNHIIRTVIPCCVDLAARAKRSSSSLISLQISFYLHIPLFESFMPVISIALYKIPQNIMVLQINNPTIPPFTINSKHST